MLLSSYIHITYDNICMCIYVYAFISIMCSLLLCLKVAKTCST